MVFYIKEDIQTLQQDSNFLINVKNSLNEYSGSFSITYGNVEFDYDTNIFKWSGTISNNIEWFFSYGEGDSGFYITANMLKLNSELVSTLSKIQGFFNNAFITQVKEKMTNKNL